MTHRTTPRFWDGYNALPAKTRDLADRAFETLKLHPDHSSLNLKKVGPFWSARVGLHHRTLALLEPEGFVWFWIGTHAEYDRLIR